jgi:hypothetical protein
MVDDWTATAREDQSLRPEVIHRHERAAAIIMTLIETADEHVFEGADTNAS